MGQLWAAVVLAVALQSGASERPPSAPRPEPVLTDPAGNAVQVERSRPESLRDSVGQTAELVEAVQERAAELNASRVPTENPNKEVIQRVRKKLKRLSELLRAKRRRRTPPVEEPAGRSGEQGATAVPPADHAEVAPVPDVPEPPQPEAVEPAHPSAESAHPVTARPAFDGERAAATVHDSATRDEKDEPESVPLLDGPVDPLAAARACLRAGQYRDALRYYRMVDSEQLSADERHWLLYEQAMCWKMVGDYERAQVLYREVASRAADRKLREACQWQLESLEWRKKTDALVRQLESATQASPGS